jgi:hypothetical protein
MWKLTSLELRRVLILLFATLALAACNLPADRFQSVSSPIASGPAVTLPPEVQPGTATIEGIVWHDLCAVPGEGQPIPPDPPAGCVQPVGETGFEANGFREVDEPPIMGVEVSLGLGACPSTGAASVMTAADGTYRFEGLDADTYCVGIDALSGPNTAVLIPGSWSSSGVSGESATSVGITVGPGESSPPVEFGWDYQFLPAYAADEPIVPTEPEASATPSVEVTPSSTPDDDATATPTPTETPPPADPDLPSGNPDWEDSFANGDNWPTYADSHVEFDVDDGNLVMTAFNADFWDGWMLTWPELEDSYVEGTFTTVDCGGGDRYGLFARGSSPENVYGGYLFGITCDGRYSLRSWDGSSFTALIPWAANSAIQSGSDQTHRLGFWSDGEQIKLYIDGKEIDSLTDSTHSAGKFGLFIGAGNTENMEVAVEEISYWLLP